MMKTKIIVAALTIAVAAPAWSQIPGLMDDPVPIAAQQAQPAQAQIPMLVPGAVQPAYMIPVPASDRSVTYANEQATALARVASGYDDAHRTAAKKAAIQAVSKLLLIGPNEFKIVRMRYYKGDGVVTVDVSAPGTGDVQLTLRPTTSVPTGYYVADFHSLETSRNDD